MQGEVLVPGVFSGIEEGVEAVLAQRGLSARWLGPVLRADIDEGLAYVDNDACLSTIAVIGQILRYLRQDKTLLRRVLAPELCHGCRSCVTPRLLADVLAQAGLGEVEVVPFSCAEVTSSTGSAFPPKTPDRICAIGIIGNIPALCTALMHEVVVNRLEAAGCAPVFVPAQIVADERAFLEGAVSWLAEAGISQAICVLPFGCLGGHAFIRGRLREILRTHPGIEVTVLDYDPSASDVNLENRVELIAQAARERTAQAARERTAQEQAAQATHEQPPEARREGKTCGSA